jgi:chromosome segregation ATPase
VYLDLLLIAAILLFLVALGASVIYHKRIRKVEKEYGKARNVVSDIITSFNSQLETQRKELATVAQKTEVLSSQTEGVTRSIAGYETQSRNFASKLDAVSDAEGKVATQIEELSKKVQKVDESQKDMSRKFEELGKARPEVVAMPRASIEAAIPIRKERALAPLTETELSVLEILAEEGRMPAPEIQERLRLTREHTSRLMKKLYVDGYLERDTRKMPYIYSIKEEMLKILKKRAAKT